MMALIDEQGSVVEVRVIEDSGWPELNSAAAELARTLGFTPARNIDEVVPAWMPLSMVFRPD